jgi:hypothetical protein
LFVLFRLLNGWLDGENSGIRQQLLRHGTTTDAGDGWLQFLQPRLFVRRVEGRSCGVPSLSTRGVKKKTRLFSQEKKMESDFEPRGRNGFRRQIKD